MGLRMHGQVTETDREEATSMWFRRPIGFVAALVFLFAPSLTLRGMACVVGLAMTFLPRKIVDAVGLTAYALIGLGGIILILIKGL